MSDLYICYMLLDVMINVAPNLSSLLSRLSSVASAFASAGRGFALGRKWCDRLRPFSETHRELKGARPRFSLPLGVSFVSFLASCLLRLGLLRGESPHRPGSGRGEAGGEGFLGDARRFTGLRTRLGVFESRRLLLEAGLKLMLRCFLNQKPLGTALNTSESCSSSDLISLGKIT